MGQKTHPKGLRLGIVKDWESSWFAQSEYKDFILDDLKIRNYVKEEFKRAGISDVKIYRTSDKIEVIIKAARAGMILGKGGADVTRYREELSELIGRPLALNIVEEKEPEKSARLLAESICTQLEKRVPFRRAMKAAVQWAMKAGALGIKVGCAGRLGGTEIARAEWYLEGKVPLHTLRADIDYAFSEALTTYGKIGVKVWIYNGDIIDHKEKKARDQEKLIAEKPVLEEALQE